MDQIALEGMPDPVELRLVRVDGQCVVTFGATVVYRYDAGDVGMRNLAIVALTDAGRRVDEVAAVFGLTATYVSMLRGRARAAGSAGLVRRRGRPPKLSARQVSRALEWAGQGWTQQAIADRLGVARSTIGELLARHPVPATLPIPDGAQDAAPNPDVAAGPPAVPAPDVQGEPAGAAEDVPAEDVQAEPQAVPAPDVAVVPAAGVAGGGLVRGAGSARIGVGGVRCRYAGVMLAHAYLDRVGAAAVLGTLTGGPARRYDDLAVLTAACLGFALGIDTVEGAKHLSRADAGAAVGMVTVPELRTLRARLAALADGGDPLALQRAFAAAMLAADPAGDPVYYVDDHFAPYAGARPVAKGWNTKRRHAQPGRDDTLVVDSRGRAVVFASAAPAGLVATLPGVLAQLRQVLGPDAPVLLGFDRGGAYPSAFTACRDAGAHWVTYRRAPLAATTAEPRQHATTRAGRPAMVALADETVTIKDYGTARQLTLFEHDTPVLQVLTSDTTAAAPDLLGWLRARWRIENMFKYAAAHNGIDALADYRMDITTDDRRVANPARAAARKAVADAQAQLATAEQHLARLLTGPGTPTDINAAIPTAEKAITTAHTTLAHAKAALRTVPAKVPATALDPDAKIARPQLPRRGLQMVLRLLAYNAEAWLAEHFNAYLADPDEYRATLRHLLHQPGTITYTPTRIIVTLDRPDTPRITRALQHLTQELNNTPAHIPGDPRPLTYQTTPA